jgi:predicted nucleic acid-binding protein
VGLLALWDRSDQWHSAATQAFQSFSQSRASLYTTSLVLLECANAAARRPYRATVAAVWNEMKAAGRLFHPTDQDWEEAWADYGRRVAGEPGLVDLISFRAMRHLEIEQAFTNDKHFRNAGFQVLF